MDRPKKLVLDDGSYINLAVSSTIPGFAILALVCGLAMIFGDATLSNLILPIASIGGLLLFWMGINLTVGLIHRLSDRRAIQRLFGGELWGMWQFKAPEWQKICQNEYKNMCPEGGPGAYVGAVYSSIFGLVFAIILVLVGKFAIKDPEIMPVIWIIAVLLFLLMLGIGLFQPVHNRREARRHFRKAYRIEDPRIWFVADGVYHETLGYTSLKELEKVTDQTRSRHAITFTISITMVFGDSSSSHSQPISFKVPSGLEKQAAQLVRRYRQERLVQ